MMAITLNIQRGEELLEKIQQLTGDEKIFIEIEEGICQDLQYCILQKTGFRNLFMSYLNSTREEINFINFQEFWDRYSNLLVKEFDLIRDTAISYMGVECFMYLTDALRQHDFYIDTQRKVIIIHVIGRNKIFEECNCGYTCSIDKL